MALYVQIPPGRSREVRHAGAVALVRRSLLPGHPLIVSGDTRFAADGAALGRPVEVPAGGRLVLSRGGDALVIDAPVGRNKSTRFDGPRTFFVPKATRSRRYRKRP